VVGQMTLAEVGLGVVVVRREVNHLAVVGMEF